MTDLTDKKYVATLRSFLTQCVRGEEIMAELTRCDDTCCVWCSNSATRRDVMNREVNSDDSG